MWTYHPETHKEKESLGVFLIIHDDFTHTISSNTAGRTRLKYELSFKPGCFFKYGYKDNKTKMLSRVFVLGLDILFLGRASECSSRQTIGFRSSSAKTPSMLLISLSYCWSFSFSFENLFLSISSVPFLFILLLFTWLLLNVWNAQHPDYVTFIILQALLKTIALFFLPFYCNFNYDFMPYQNDTNNSSKYTYFSS